MPVKPLPDRAMPAIIAGPPPAAIKVRTEANTGPPKPRVWNVREWVSSLLIHGLFLLAMGFWYFQPPSNPPNTLDTRLLGSESGVEDGMFPAGGLNTEIELTQIDLNPPTPKIEFTPSVEPISIDIKSKPKPKPKPEPKPKLETVETRTAAGGLENPNPGAGDGDGFGLARFGEGGESIQGVQIKVGDPQFTLIWNSEADLDLHVFEPGGKEIKWEQQNGDFGGHLDVDNSKGFGPENIYWRTEDESTGELVKTKGPPGEYQWYVEFWGGLDGKIRPTVWKVRVKHAGKVEFFTGRFRVLNEKSKRYTLKVEGPPTPATPAVEPGKAH